MLTKVMLLTIAFAMESNALAEGGLRIGVSFPSERISARLDGRMLLMFSTDPSGAPPSGSIIYDVGMDPNSYHRLFDLVPGVGYHINVALTDSGRRIEVAQGGIYHTSDQGVLEFDLREIEPTVSALAAGR